MKVRIVYRNYKPLHDLYASLKTFPPEGVSYFIPNPKRYLRYLLPLHRRLGSVPAVRLITDRIQDLVFNSPQTDVDLYHFAQIIPRHIPRSPSVIDFEHISAVVGYAGTDPLTAQRISHFLENPRVCRIMPFSLAARASMEYLLKDSYDRIAKKVEVIYPALPNYALEEEANYTYVSRDADTFKLLFVGSGIDRKGLYELLLAFQQLEGKYDDIELYVVSNAPRHLIRRHTSSRLKFLPPRFSRSDIVKQLFLPCDLFVLPTHSDTFGMALLCSLACGTPVLTTKQFAAPEIVESGHNGLFVHSDYLHLLLHTAILQSLLLFYFSPMGLIPSGQVFFQHLSTHFLQVYVNPFHVLRYIGD